VSRTVPGRQPRVAGAQRWVASERQLLGDRKYANAIVRGWILRGEHERCLGDVEPSGKLLHPGDVETRPIENDGYRIAGSRAGPEDIDVG